MRVARYGRRPGDNDDVDSPTVHHCAVDDIATDDIATDDIHDGDRAVEFVHVDEQHHAATHDNNSSGRSSDIGLNVGLS
jgi:hypothetical protein